VVALLLPLPLVPAVLRLAVTLPHLWKRRRRKRVRLLNYHHNAAQSGG
jgi:hypothetical protein